METITKPAAVRTTVRDLKAAVATLKRSAGLKSTFDILHSVRVSGHGAATATNMEITVTSPAGLLPGTGTPYHVDVPAVHA